MTNLAQHKAKLMTGLATPESAEKVKKPAPRAARPSPLANPTFLQNSRGSTPARDGHWNAR